MNSFLMIYLIGVGLSLLFCFIFIRYIQKELKVGGLPVALICIAGSFVGILAMLVSVACVYVEENGDKIVWKEKEK